VTYTACLATLPPDLKHSLEKTLTSSTHDCNRWAATSQNLNCSMCFEAYLACRATLPPDLEHWAENDYDSDTTTSQNLYNLLHVFWGAYLPCIVQHCLIWRIA
jgi:hypothetical protein